MSVTFSHSAYYGNDGELLSGWASLAKGFALVRSHQDFKQQIPTLLQGLPKNFFNDKLLDTELKKRKHLYLFSILMSRMHPYPLVNGETMRSSNQDLGTSNSVFYVKTDDEEEDKLEHTGEDEWAHPLSAPSYRSPKSRKLDPIPPGKKPHYA